MTFVCDVTIRVIFKVSFPYFLEFGQARWDCVTKGNFFMCAHNCFFSFQVLVSPAENNSRCTFVTTFFLINVECDELGVRWWVLVRLSRIYAFKWIGNRRWIPFTFHVYSRYLAATRDVHSTATGYKWLIFRFTTMMQRNQSAHTAWLSSEMKMVLIIITLLISQNTSRSCWWSGGER